MSMVGKEDLEDDSEVTAGVNEDSLASSSGEEPPQAKRPASKVIAVTILITLVDDLLDMFLV
jgi:hypothetical protein